MCWLSVNWCRCLCLCSCGCCGSSRTAPGHKMARANSSVTEQPALCRASSHHSIREAVEMPAKISFVLLFLKIVCLLYCSFFHAVDVYFWKKIIIGIFPNYSEQREENFSLSKGLEMKKQVSHFSALIKVTLIIMLIIHLGKIIFLLKHLVLP